VALPDDLDTVEITGRWVGLDGQPSAGRVTLAPTAERLVSVATETTIIGVPITLPLDAQGAMHAEVPATDDPDIAGGPWYYTVTVQASRRSYSFPLVVPTGSEPIDLADYTPPTGVPDVPEPYVLSVNGATGHVIIPEGRPATRARPAPTVARLSSTPTPRRSGGATPTARGNRSCRSPTWSGPRARRARPARSGRAW
jgi:hypothetical protein